MIVIAIYPEFFKPPSFQKINFEGKVYMRVSNELLFFTAEKVELIVEEERMAFEAKKGVIGGVAIHFGVTFEECKCIASLMYDLLKEVNETAIYRGSFNFSKADLRVMSRYSTEDNLMKRSTLKDFFFELREVTENV